MNNEIKLLTCHDYPELKLLNDFFLFQFSCLKKELLIKKIVYNEIYLFLQQTKTAKTNNIHKK